MMGYDSIKVANEIILIASERKNKIKMTKTKLINILYLCHYWTLCLTSKPLCKDRPEAWPYGPMFKNVYARLNCSEDIPCDFILEEFYPVFENNFSEDEKAIINKIIENYGNISAFQLVTLNTDTESPYKLAIARSGIRSVISDDLILLSYKK